MSIQSYLEPGFTLDDVPSLEHVPLSPHLFCQHNIASVKANFKELKSLNNRNLLEVLGVHPDVSGQIGRIPTHLFAAWFNIPWYLELRALIRLIR